MDGSHIRKESRRFRASKYDSPRETLLPHMVTKAKDVISGNGFQERLDL